MKEMTRHWKQVLLLLGVCILGVRSHGRLLDPPMRASLWRFKNNMFNAPVHYTDNQLNCGGLGNPCAVCGDNDNLANKLYQEGGKYDKQIIPKTYSSGCNISVTVEITANHKGWFEFRLCPMQCTDWNGVTQCLDNHLLRGSFITGNIHGVTRFDIGSRSGFLKFELDLPANVECDKCLFQWKYVAGNNYAPPQETFINCADIAIKGKDPTCPVHIGDVGSVSGSYTCSSGGSNPQPNPNPPVSNSGGQSGGSSQPNSGQGNGNMQTTTTEPEHTTESNEDDSPSDDIPTPDSDNPPTSDSDMPSGRKSCQAIGFFVHMLNADSWCDSMCNHVPQACHPGLCMCRTIEPDSGNDGGSSNGNGAVNSANNGPNNGKQCFATAAYPDKDAWCQRNCNWTPPYCPATHCWCT